MNGHKNSALKKISSLCIHSTDSQMYAGHRICLNTYTLPGRTKRNQYLQKYKNNFTEDEFSVVHFTHKNNVPAQHSLEEFLILEFPQISQINCMARSSIVFYLSLWSFSFEERCSVIFCDPNNNRRDVNVFDEWKISLIFNPLGDNYS